MAIRIMIPEKFIQLHLEIKHHPLLVQRLQKHPRDCGPEIVLAEVAAYCFVEVKGEFVEEELAKLAAICLYRLKQMKPKKEIYLPPDDYSHLYENILKEQWIKDRERNRK
jgi:hypothetical protein